MIHIIIEGCGIKRDSLEEGMIKYPWEFEVKGAHSDKVLLYQDFKRWIEF